ncbi:MAG: PRC-barrel domain-containing protein [Rhodospirillum sp.]|nr:PRC-barrel domain-containing protein [Rhodospirillum sp.]MCF8492110.1 PRC-barrel domain-containing protein [Rhodospirillum sp.]MCF8501158.1 PRC-barrel domain-containing protein [Rhodospirillum sp.]
MRHNIATVLVLASALIVPPLGSAAFAKSFGDNAAALSGDPVYGSDGYIVGHVIGATDSGTGDVAFLTVGVESGGEVQIPSADFSVNRGEGRVTLNLTTAQMDDAGLIDQAINFEYLGSPPRAPESRAAMDPGRNYGHAHPLDASHTMS